MVTREKTDSPVPPAIFHATDPMALVRERSSWRSFSGEGIDPSLRGEFQERMDSIGSGPFGNLSRFHLIEATPEDPEALKGLGTYGFVRGMPAFLVGVADSSRALYLEDFGYMFELALLHATDLGLASCWLGGSFQRARFAEAIELSGKDVIPAISPLGYRAKSRRVVDNLIRSVAGSKKRKEFDELFSGLDTDSRKRWEAPLEAVRLAPSASNKQPWRVHHSPETRALEFSMVRSPGYREQGEKKGLCDLQRIDMGIGMAHFELQARHENLSGKWVREAKGDGENREGEYLVSWKFG